jgi:hypothetical protein
MASVTILGVTFALWQWILIPLCLWIIVAKLPSGVWKIVGLLFLAAAIFVIKTPALHRFGHAHELYDSTSGLKVALPTEWIQWDAAKLMSADARKQEIIAFAGDPDRKATVLVRQFKLFLMPGDLYPISYDFWSGLDASQRDKQFEILLTGFKSGLQQNLDLVDIQGTKHRGPTPRAFVLEVEGIFRERGEGEVWRKYFIFLPAGQERNQDQILQIRFEVPVADRTKYQGELQTIEHNLQTWIDSKGT